MGGSAFCPLRIMALYFLNGPLSLINILLGKKRMLLRERIAINLLKHWKGVLTLALYEWL